MRIESLSIIDPVNKTILVPSFSCPLAPGDKIALIGEEGNGKSTFLKALAGIGLDRLDVKGGIAPRAAVSYLPQDLVGTYAGLSTIDFLLRKSPEAEIDPEDYSLLAEVDRLREEVGLSADAFDLDKPFSAYSGGERLKLGFLKLRLSYGEVYLLDEPSNDIDIEGLQYLENFLKNTAKPIVFVCHDRRLLERVSNATIELWRTRIGGNRHIEYRPVGYAEYVAEVRSEEERSLQVGRFKREQLTQRERRLAAIKQRVEHDQNQAVREPTKGRLLKKKMHVVKSQERQLEKQWSSLDPLPEERLSFHYFFSPDISVSPSKRFPFHFPLLQAGDRVLGKDIDLLVKGGEKLFLIGPNGTGKTTLLRALRDALRNRTDIRLGYFPQDYAEALDYSLTPIEALRHGYEKEEEAWVRGLLGAAFFSEAEMLGPIANLSEGEKAKLLAIKIAYDKADFLLLDEPTRNLSVGSASSFGEALAAFSGTVVVATHDLHLREKVGGEVLRFPLKGKE